MSTKLWLSWQTRGWWGGGHPGNAAHRYLLRMAAESSSGNSCRAATSFCKSSRGFCSLKLFPAAQWEAQRVTGNPAFLKALGPQGLGKERRAGDNHCFSKACCFCDDLLLYSFGMFKMPQKVLQFTAITNLLQIQLETKIILSGKRVLKGSGSLSPGWDTAAWGCCNPASHSRTVSATVNRSASAACARLRGFLFNPWAVWPCELQFTIFLTVFQKVWFAFLLMIAA